MGAALADAAVVQQPPLVGYQPNGTVRDIIVVGNTAYLGGQFTSLTSANGATTVTRNHAAAIDMTTGNLLPWNPNVNGTVYAILPSGSNVYRGRVVHHRSAVQRTRTSPRSTPPVVRW